MKENLEFMVKNIGIKVRQCQKSDYTFVYGIVKKMIFPFVREFYKPSKKMFDERFEKDYSERRILLVGKRRIGFYQLTPQKNHLDVTGIFLLEAYQGKGIGCEFMKYFETLGYKKIQLQVWENNPAYKFYEKIGYEIISKNNHKYLMKKEI